MAHSPLHNSSRQTKQFKAADADIVKRIILCQWENVVNDMDLSTLHLQSHWCHGPSVENGGANIDSSWDNINTSDAWFSFTYSQPTTQTIRNVWNIL